MAVDSLDKCGIYFGTTGGQVYASADAGDSWAPIVRDLPAVFSVEVQTLGWIGIQAEFSRVRSSVMADGVSHQIEVRKKTEFLHRLMLELAGNAHLSLEGDLSRCWLTDDLAPNRNETAVLKRNTTAPVQDFVVLRLTRETVDPIFKQVVAAGLKRAIIHVQIERDGVLELGAYDHFQRECVVVGPGISPALLDELTKTNVLWGFKAAAPGR